MIQYLLLISRQGKVRLSKWYQTGLTSKEKARAIRDACNVAIGRSVKYSNFVEINKGDNKDGATATGRTSGGTKLVCRRYASLYFVAAIDEDDNELLAMETIHLFVEALDRYFENVSELDLIFNFHRAYLILDEVLLAGEVQETSKRHILKQLQAQEAVIEEQGKLTE